MSSDYRVICLSHDPAIEVDHDWIDADRALASIRDGLEEEHPSCDLLVGRWSGGLVEVCCPGMVNGAPSNHSGWHREPKWADAGWLRLAVLAGLDVVKLARLYPCWTYDRAHRLRVILDVAKGTQ